MSAHTPGPWTEGKKTNGDPCICAGPMVVCYITPRWTTTNPEEWRHNAKLISASPELLAVARDLQRYHSDHDWALQQEANAKNTTDGNVSFSEVLHERLAAAIAQAEGRR